MKTQPKNHYEEKFTQIENELIAEMIKFKTEIIAEIRALREQLATHRNSGRA